MITLVNGIAGSDTLLDEAEGEIKAYTAAHSYQVTGFGIIEISETVIKYEELLTTQEEPIDEFRIYLDRSLPVTKSNLKYSKE